MDKESVVESRYDILGSVKEETSEQDGEEDDPVKF